MNKNTRTWLPLSFVPTVDGEIDQLLESLQAKHKAEKNISKLRENADAILQYVEQIFKWKRDTQSNVQQQRLSTLEQKLSHASRLNFKLLALKEKAIDQKFEHEECD